jgi:predicted permease
MDWNDIRLRLRGIFFRRQVERELDEELKAHLELRARKYQEAGMAPEEAHLVARRTFGNLTLVKEDTRKMWGWISLERLAQDLRHGVRLVRLNPAFAMVAILSLALGIGANTAIFQLLDAVRLRSLPVKNPQELAQVRLADGDGGCCSFDGRYPDLTYALWEQLQKHQQAFSEMSAWSTDTFNLATGGEARYSQGLWVSGDFFSMLGVQPIRGRLFSSADDRRGCGLSTGVVVSYPFWQREFGGEASVIGEAITLEGHPFEIIGVTPQSFFGVEVGRTFDVAVPICAESIIKGGDSNLDRRWAWWLAAMGRLKPGWSLERATAYLNSISPGLFQSTEPTDLKVNGYLNYKLSAFPAASGFSVLREQYETPIVLLMAIAGLTLLIACLNLGILMLARANARAREMAVRFSLGASRGRLVRQLLVETLVLTIAGATLGACLAPALSHVLVSFLSTSKNPLFVDLHINFRLFAFTAVLAGLTCLLSGLTPALRATRTGLIVTMKADGRGLTLSRQRFGLQRALVVSQVALSLVLLVGALLFVQSFRNLSTLDAGFREDGVLISDLDLSKLKIPDERRAAYTEELLESVRRVPGVASAAASRIVPLSGNGWTQNVLIDHSSTGGKLSSRFNSVTPGYFQTLSIPLLSGRDFDQGDTATSPKVAIVNESFARLLLAGANPIGRTFGLKIGNSPETTYQIVGVANDTKYFDLREQFTPIAFLAASQDDNPRQRTHLLIRSNQESAALISTVRSSIGQASPDIGIDFHVFKTQVQESLVRERLMATLSGLFGFLAVLLATIGLYGVIAYMVTRRRNEIGIRMALGADGRSVVAMIMREAAILLAIGLAAGLMLAGAAATAARALLFGLRPRDPVTFIMAPAILAVVALTASYLPAHRVAGLDPMSALREE